MFFRSKNIFLNACHLLSEKIKIWEKVKILRMETVAKIVFKLKEIVTWENGAREIAPM